MINFETTKKNNQEGLNIHPTELFEGCRQRCKIKETRRIYRHMVEYWSLH